MKRSRSRSLWCVTKGRAVAPPAIMFMHGVSTYDRMRMTLTACGEHDPAIAALLQGCDFPLHRR